MYTIDYAEGWDVHYATFDPSIRIQIAKKIEHLIYLGKVRHLKFGLPLFVAEAGQYRICFEQKESARLIVFVGNHKQYDEWCRKME